jgi:uncharacterized protein with HEPN domain
MKERDMQRIRHIMTYCEDIAASIKRFGVYYETFVQDKDYFNSVSMCLMQIGELAGGLSDEFKDVTRSRIQWGPIRAMRNLFAHSYAVMSKSIIWETATKDIPELLRFCMTIVNMDTDAQDRLDE